MEDHTLSSIHTVRYSPQKDTSLIMVELHQQLMMDPLDGREEMSEESDGEDISYTELKKRMWKDKMRMKKFKTAYGSAEKGETSGSASRGTFQAKEDAEIPGCHPQVHGQDHASVQSPRLCLRYHP